MALTPSSGTSGLTEEQRSLALARFHILRPFLEESVPLASIAQQHDLNPRTVRRWAKNYRQHGLALIAHPHLKNEPHFVSTRQLSNHVEVQGGSISCLQTVPNNLPSGTSARNRLRWISKADGF